MRGRIPVLEVLADLEAGFLHKVIAERHGMSITMVSNIKTGKRYRKVIGSFRTIQFNALLTTLAFTGAA